MKGRLFKLVKETPGHKPGDLLYKVDGLAEYVFSTAPYYSLGAEQVENHPDYFEEVVLDWVAGETIHFVGLNGVVYSDAFDTAKHASLVYFNNSFKTKADADYINTIIQNVFAGKYVMLLDEEEYTQLKFMLHNDEYDKMIKFLNDKKLH